MLMKNGRTNKRGESQRLKELRGELQNILAYTCSSSQLRAEFRDTIQNLKNQIEEETNEKRVQNPNK